MTDTVYIHADAAGTYQGNGGFIMLNELSVQLGRMGYAVAWFDHMNRLQPDMWAWTGYDVPAIISFDDAMQGDAPMVTTWLYSWLDTLKRHPLAFPRLRYWCSGELLRDEPQYDASRAFVREHVGEIAINNPSLAQWYEQMDITPRWHWTNWVRELFTPDTTHHPLRVHDLIGYQPDRDDKVGDRLRAEFGAHLVITCTGSHPEVAQKMRACDVFLAWNDLWPMVCGGGESFGLNAFEAMASGCVTFARRHCGNELLMNGTARLHTQLDSAIRRIMNYILTGSDMPYSSHAQQRFIETFYRFDNARRKAIRGYLDA